MPRLTHDIDALIDESAPGVWRYRGALALSSDVLVLSLGEGRTPVVDLPDWGSAHGLTRCHAKLEYMAPTGSFKDRGAAPVIASLKAQGAAKIVEDSSGNAGAAMAAYAARAGLAADIYVPAAAPAGKIAQIAQYGATVHRVEGTREDVACRGGRRRAGARRGLRLAQPASGIRRGREDVRAGVAGGRRGRAAAALRVSGGQRRSHPRRAQSVE